MLAIIAAIAFLRFYDWDQARPFINEQVTNSIGRKFAIQGKLEMRLARGPHAKSTWEHYLPVLQVSANDVQVDNPSWSNVGPRAASASRASFSLEVLPLLRRKIVLPDIELDAPQVALERSADGRNSWALKDTGPSAWVVQVQRMAFTDGKVRYLDDGINLDLHAQVSSVAGNLPDSVKPVANADAEQQFGMTFSLAGTYHKAPISGGGKAGAILSLENENTIYPVEADTQIGANKIAVKGVITDPRSPSGIDVQLTLGGASLADLFPLTGVLLPETPAYKTQGRLLGQKDKDNWNWTYRNFSGSVGGSDLSGTLQYTSRQPRPLLSGALTSNQLRLEDLGPTVGADSNEHKVARGHAPVQPDNKALPVEQFNTQKWGALDADVTFAGKRLVRTHDIPLEDVVTTIHMKDRVLSLEPLNFGMAGGDITSNVSMDGRKPNIDAQIKMAARNLKVRELFPNLQSMKASFGEVNGDAALTGHGNSVSAMLATSNGEFAATVSQGSVSQFVLEAAGLNVANAVFVKVFGDKQVQMNCLVSNFAVKDGVAGVRRFVLDTDDAVIDITGDIDMAREQLNLDVNPKTKGVRIFSLRTPLYAKGSFEHPDVGPYKGPLVLRAGAAVALAAVAPAAAAIPLVNPGKTTDIDCASEMVQALKTRGAPSSEATAAPAKPVSSKEIQVTRKSK